MEDEKMKKKETSINIWGKIEKPSLRGWANTRYKCKTLQKHSIFLLSTNDTLTSFKVPCSSKSLASFEQLVLIVHVL